MKRLAKRLVFCASIKFRDFYFYLIQRHFKVNLGNILVNIKRIMKEDVLKEKE